MGAHSAPVNNGQGSELFHINTDGKAIFINHSLPNNNIVLLWLALAGRGGTSTINSETNINYNSNDIFINIYLFLEQCR